MFKGLDWDDDAAVKSVVSDIIKRMESKLCVPTTQHDELHAELDEYYSIVIEDNMNAEEIKELLSYIQNTRSRVAYIYVQAMQSYRARKTILDTLTSIISKEADPKIYKNKEARDGFAAEKLAGLILNVQIDDFLRNNAETCLSNLSDMMSTVSRQISVMQIELQLGELARPASHTNQPYSNYQEDATWDSDGSVDRDLQELSSEDEDSEDTSGVGVEVELDF